jgi:hypothetical protein
MEQALALTFWLMVGHSLADYPLQGDFLAKAKDPDGPFASDYHIPAWASLSHAAIHAGFVTFITGSLLLGALELVAHWGIDMAKCMKLISFNTDQWLHTACKLFYVSLFIIYPAMFHPFALAL